VRTFTCNTSWWLHGFIVYIDILYTVCTYTVQYVYICNLGIEVIQVVVRRRILCCEGGKVHEKRGEKMTMRQGGPIGTP
jgi:hypothetical protein